METVEQQVRSIVDRHVTLDYDDYPTSCSPYSIAHEVAEFIRVREEKLKLDTVQALIGDAKMLARVGMDDDGEWKVIRVVADAQSIAEGRTI